MLRETTAASNRDGPAPTGASARTTPVSAAPPSATSAARLVAARVGSAAAAAAAAAEATNSGPSVAYDPRRRVMLSK